MITFKQGDIFESHAEALVNPVNLAGVSGKGLALKFKKRFPMNFDFYRTVCKTRPVKIGDLFPFIYQKGDKDLKRNNIHRDLIIINFPTKDHYSMKSSLDILERGLHMMIKWLDQSSIASVAIPALGCGEGGLHWPDVKDLMVRKMSFLTQEIEIYEPL